MDKQIKMLSTAKRLRNAKAKELISEGDTVIIKLDINGEEKIIGIDLANGKIV